MSDQPQHSRMTSSKIITRVLSCPTQINAGDWDALLEQQAAPTPFMQHAYLCALHESGSATPETGWTPQFFTLWENNQLIAACPAYVKTHSYGEYVFDWAWARAYAQHGLDYYPKLLIAIPFTPVSGTRLMARDAATRALLVQTIANWCASQGLSSVHMLFAHEDDLRACPANIDMDDNAIEHATWDTSDGVSPWMRRTTVQFHWNNESAIPSTATAAKKFTSFDEFLGTLTQEKRKKIKQERKRVADAGVTFRWVRGSNITAAEWAFFYRCYERTYLEHGNPPYLQLDFFERMATDMPDTWVLFIAEREGHQIASSLIAINTINKSDKCQKTPDISAYGRYWGALERVDCLHFEACYYQPLQWCIEHGVQRFEGGAQGEHKMARALLPSPTYSAHWLSHPAFADAVARYLERESVGVSAYLEHLAERSPIRRHPVAADVSRIKDPLHLAQEGSA